MVKIFKKRRFLKIIFVYYRYIINNENQRCHESVADIQKTLYVHAKSGFVILLCQIRGITTMKIFIRYLIRM